MRYFIQFSIDIIRIRDIICVNILHKVVKNVKTPGALGKKYFISYTYNDKRWATWIAEIIERYGGTVRIQAWDIQAGDNFVLKMDEFIKKCDIVVPVYSSDYFQSYYCNKELAAAFAKAKGGVRTMIPVRITDVEPDGLFKAEVYSNLFGITDEAAAIDVLLKGLDRLLPRGSEGSI